MKKLLLFTTLFLTFSVNAQLNLINTFGGNGSQGTIPYYSMCVYNGKLYFLARVNSETQYFRTDGTTAGLESITYNSNPIINNFGTSFMKEYNGVLYFDGLTSGIASSVFTINNSSAVASVAMNIYSYTGFYGGRFVDSAYLNNKILFTPFQATSGYGIEPYLIDLGNSSNNGLVKDINAGIDSSSPRYFTTVNNTILFAATDVTNGRELWKTDGTTTGTQLLANINFGNADSNPDNFAVLGSNMLFAASNAVTGRELFTTDGTTSGTIILKNINNGSGDSDPNNLTTIDNKVYFTATDGVTGLELWVSDGTESGTYLLKDINPSGDSNPYLFTKVGSNIFFVADDGSSGSELWKTDGTSGGTVMVKDLTVGSTGSVLSIFKEHNGRLYFRLDNQLWVSDGTSSGTNYLNLDKVSNMISFNNQLFIKKYVNVFSSQLWTYNDAALSTNDFELNGKTISLYPNPSNDVFQLQSDLAIEKVELYSLQGQLVKSFQAQNQYNIADVAKGMYLVKINTQEGIVNKTLVVK